MNQHKTCPPCAEAFTRKALAMLKLFVATQRRPLKALLEQHTWAQAPALLLAKRGRCFFNHKRSNSFEQALRPFEY